MAYLGKCASYATHSPTLMKVGTYVSESDRVVQVVGSHTIAQGQRIVRLQTKIYS